MSFLAKERYLLIDTMRGIASVWILCFHVLPNYIQDNEFLSSIIEFGRIGTDFFFVASGFAAGIACNKILQSDNLFVSSKRFLTIRLKRIYTIYFFSLLVALYLVPFLMSLVSFLKSGELVFSFYHIDLLEFILYASLFQVFSADTWALNEAFVEINGVYWFIAILIQIFLFLGLALQFKRYFWFILFAMFLVSLLSLYPSLKELIPVGLFIPKFSEFYLGILLWFVIYKQNVINQDVLRKISFLFFIIALTFVVYFHSNGLKDDWFRFLSALSVTTLLIYLFPFDKKLSQLFFLKIFQKLGKFSYSIYLNHIVFWPFMYMFVSNLVPLPLSVSAPIFLVPMIILCSFVFYAFFERPNNLQSLLRGLFMPASTIRDAFISLK